MNKIKSVLFSAGISLALGFTFGCSGDDSSENGSLSSSGKATQSGSSTLKECNAIFNPDNKFCYDGVVYDKCDGMAYNPSSQICENGVAIPAKCRNESYNPITQRCTYGIVETNCYGIWYSQATQSCGEDGMIYDNKCNGKSYEPSTQGCCGNFIYNNQTQFCINNGINNGIYDKCNGKSYEPPTQGCCGNFIYNNQNLFCENNGIYVKCNGKSYNPLTQGCGAGEIVDTKCGSSWYNQATQFCEDNRIYAKCNESYNPLTQYCGNGTVKNYDGSIIDARDGKKYNITVIGSQTWMAENLNYVAEGSKCYGEDGKVMVSILLYDYYITLSNTEIQANCATYGRLYNWTTAMIACPSGWHLPSNDEWTMLINFVDTDRTGGTKQLRATSVWSNVFNVPDNGTNDFGFSALPGGAYFDSYLDVGHRGLWWSASEYDSSSAYNNSLRYSYKNVDDYEDKSDLFSVRCVKD